MKTKYWILALGALAVLCAALTVFLLPRGQSPQAEVYSCGQLLATIDLVKDQQFMVTSSDGGTNTVTVRDGKLAVTHASCPDQICVHLGYCSSGQIICLPNRLVILFPQAKTDAVAG